MKVLVHGSSGVAHALVWKLFNSSRIDQLASLPGNGGANILAPIAPGHGTIKESVRWAYDEEFNVIVPADGGALTDGLVDEATPLKVAVWGPPRRSALLERSPLWAKEFLNRYKIPTSAGRAFGDFATAERYLAAHSLPVMLAGDYPSEFDGAYMDRGSAMAALEGIFALPPRDGHFRGVVIEAPPAGPTVSFSCLTDGATLLPLLPARIYDRLDDGDGGWAAPGMGAHTSSSPLLGKVGEYIHKLVMEPLLAALRQENLAWWGVLGVDCAVTAEGPKVMRIRTTLGDPEAQAVLPRLEDDLFPLIAACNNRTLHTLPPLRWKPGASVGVTLVAQGYPHSFPTGMSIGGISDLEPGVMAFHSETVNPSGLSYVSVQMQMPEKRSLITGFGEALSDAMLVRPTGPTQLSTMGGRALTVVALGDSLEAARARAYANLGRITMQRSYNRTDIAAGEI
ncbi:MAG TPA: phosphoribosylglycinamide synthetase C domain-containing protein [Herpetosiphonaceae bacterium]|nr:phosphoribosylglycinamide synthetase C domain-containing protein [Herpetosiphonaceae bacterium]